MIWTHRSSGLVVVTYCLSAPDPTDIAGVLGVDCVDCDYLYFLCILVSSAQKCIGWLTRSTDRLFMRCLGYVHAMSWIDTGTRTGNARLNDLLMPEMGPFTRLSPSFHRDN